MNCFVSNVKGSKLISLRGHVRKTLGLHNRKRFGGFWQNNSRLFCIKVA